MRKQSNQIPHAKITIVMYQRVNQNENHLNIHVEKSNKVNLLYFVGSILISVSAMIKSSSA